MTTATDLASGKSHTDENFPVASVLIHPRHRPVILAFYRFARAADDIADNETASAEDKLRLLDQMHRGLSGLDNSAPEAAALHDVLAERKLTTQHASDLLEAFRRDVVKLRYANWDELMDYCRYSAMPVGRFVLDVHGEGHNTWPASDALCAALQVINHLQDCGKDYRVLNRVYIPLDSLAAANTAPEALGLALLTATRFLVARKRINKAGLQPAAHP
jgi:squalene synthase HpnC